MVESTLAGAGLPATSAPWAMPRYGRSRAAELDALLQSVRLRPGMVVVDIQAAGGFVADEVHRRLDGRVQCICIEPSDLLRARIPAPHVVLADPVHRFGSLPDGCADAVLGLAGLHHSADAGQTLQECSRVLRPAGECAICDVIPGSAVARWLNEFVNRHNPAGHRGRFYTGRQMTDLFQDAGLTGVKVRRRSVPWVFRSRRDLETFFRGLFGLHCDDRTLEQGIGRYLRVEEGKDGCRVDWRLHYAYGRKAD